MENNNAPLLEMRNIQKDFFGNQVLTDINFTLKEGEVLGLVGENGAGKSTLMKILFGMDVIRETGGYKGDAVRCAEGRYRHGASGILSDPRLHRHRKHSAQP